jgi:protein-tyrosine phosphatase
LVEADSTVRLIDLHCHILPGIDDGPDDLQSSLELARLLSEEGVETVAATPHLREDHPEVRPTELRARCDDLRQALSDAGIDLMVVNGGEVDLLWALTATDDDLALVSYGQAGSWLLIETPNGPLPATFEQSLAELRGRGYRVLLAHPERSADFQAHPERLLELTRDGVALQVTASTLGQSRRQSKSARLAYFLLDHDAVHALSSDAHGASGHRRAPEWRALETSGLSRDRIEWMVQQVPAAILAGSILPPAPEAWSKLPRRSFVSRLRGTPGKV